MKRILTLLVAVLALTTFATSAESRVEFTRKDGEVWIKPLPGASLESTLQTETGYWLPVPEQALKTSPTGELIDTRSDAPSRFYRWYLAPEDHYSGDFRLTDHAGKTHHLFYHSAQAGLASVVLYFFTSSCDDWTNDIPQLKHR